MLDTKTCKRCEIERPITRFTIYNGTGGVKKRLSICKVCSPPSGWAGDKLATYWKTRYHNNPELKARRQNQLKITGNIRRLRIKQRLAELKLQSGCSNCGFNSCAEALDFHHKIASEKLFLLSQAHQHPWNTVLKEIEKCKILCVNCHRIEEYELYHKNPKQCKLVSKNIRNKKNRDKKRLFLSEYKVQRGCVDCGYKQHNAALDFDHLPQFEKVHNIASMLEYSFESIQNEIDKCEVVCANCHRKRTQVRMK